MTNSDEDDTEPVAILAQQEGIGCFPYLLALSILALAALGIWRFLVWYF